MESSPRYDLAADFSRESIEAIEDPVVRLRVLMKRLLGPGGCPWDRKQTHASLKQYLIEEAYEACEAIDRGDDAELAEELGDVALQVVFHAELAEAEGRFKLEDVYKKIVRKLLDRHPHVFGETHADTAEKVLKNWEEIKKEERRVKAEAAGGERHSALDGVPRALPALQRALRLQEKAARVGFDWPEVEGVAEKVKEEAEEFLQATNAAGPPETRHERMREELGDLLFSLVNLSRFLDLRPEEALNAACDKFTQRFHALEDVARASERDLKQMSLEEMDDIWNEVKRRQP